MRNTSNITCPKCGAEVPLTEALSHRIREELATEFNKERQEHNAALAQREAGLEQLKQKLEQRAKSLEETVAGRLGAERVKLLAHAAQTAEQKVSVEMTDLRGQVEDQKSKLKQAQQAELNLLREKRGIEQARETLALDVARQLDGERAQIAEKARQQAIEAERLKLNDKENVIKDLQFQIAALKQRAEQGSVQLQGETLELSLQEGLREAFPYDEIVEVKKGERGADLIQRVRTNQGMECGSILWEAKRAKNWGGNWPAKLKEDQREAKAELAVLVTTSLPEGVRGIGQLDGVWVCEPLFACVLGAALRQGLISTAVERSQESGRADKMAQMYRYVCSVEFRQQIDGIVESFIALQEQIASEQRAFARQWKERGQHLSNAINHTARLYGSIQGIAGRAALPQIQTLELPAASDTSESEQEAA
jgi:hypothetical protein